MELTQVFPMEGLRAAPPSTLLPHRFGVTVIGTETLLPDSTPGECEASAIAPGCAHAAPVAIDSRLDAAAAVSTPLPSTCRLSTCRMGPSLSTGAWAGTESKVASECTAVHSEATPRRSALPSRAEGYVRR
ncbi:predicted protein [Streptomyces sp. C]|nr:predicted protein [Streptomyces sp. C]